MKNNIKKKVAFASMFVALLTIVSCNNGNNPSEKKSQQADGSSQQAGSTKKKSSSAFVFSSIDEATLPDYNVKIVGADDAVISNETVKHGRPLTKPADPTNVPAGKRFYGWMNVKNGGQIWDFDAQDLNVVMGDVELKPLFVDDLQPQVFEAELCPAITEDRGGQGMEGATYSGGAKGKQLVNRAFDGEYKASGSYIQDDDGTVRFADSTDDPGMIFGGYVHFMYAKGDTLTWELNSDAAASNVTLFARFAGEYAKADPVTGEKKFTLTDEEFQVKVNGVKINYGSFTLHNIPETGQFTTFQDYFMSATLDLNEGVNKVEMVVNNDFNLFSTIAAAAPCVDCIKVLSSSNITWPKAKLANLERD